MQCFGSSSSTLQQAVALLVLCSGSKAAVTHYLERVVMLATPEVLLQPRNALTGDFVYDDTYAIVQNPDVYSSSPLANLLKNDFWGFPLQSEKSHKSFRPLTTLTFRVEMSQMGNTADKQVANMMHRTNVILHGINTALLVPLYRKLGFSGKECFIASMLFACHPVHAEAVANLVGRAELLAALFTILSILLWSPSNKRWPLSMLLGSLALLCKETAAVVALPMCTVMQTLKPPKKPASRLKTVLPLLLLAVLLAARVSLHGGIHQRPFLHRESNPAAFAENMATRILSLHFYLFRRTVSRVFSGTRVPSRMSSESDMY